VGTQTTAMAVRDDTRRAGRPCAQRLAWFHSRRHCHVPRAVRPAASEPRCCRTRPIRIPRGCPGILGSKLASIVVENT